MKSGKEMKGIENSDTIWDSDRIYEEVFQAKL